MNAETIQDRSVENAAIKVGDKVKFVGPLYTPDGNGPTIGQKGTVIRREGYTSQRPGQQAEEIITVHFEGEKKASNLSINRIVLAE